jgi:hypothetical protein
MTTDKMVDPWTEKDCDHCGIRFQFTRTEPRPARDEYVCPDCAAYERGTKEAENELERVKAELAAADAEIEAWKDASGLIDASGDPDGVTPAAARRWWADFEGRLLAREAQAQTERDAYKAASQVFEHELHEQAKCRRAAEAEERAELERVKAERDRLKAAREGLYFHEASEADLRAALSRLAYAAGVYYEADHASAPAHPADVADVVEQWIKVTQARADEADDLRAELERVKAERNQAQANYEWMVQRAADEKLDGYRELGARVAQAEAERDHFKTQLREASERSLAAEVRLEAARAECDLVDSTAHTLVPTEDVGPWDDGARYAARRIRRALEGER